MTTHFSERRFDTGKIAINIADGPANGPSLLMLHGLTGNWHGFEELMTALSPQRHVLSCDLRGHGKSGRREGEYRITDYARDVCAIVAACSGPVVLLGHSLGAIAALAAAAAEPQRVRALVLIDPGLSLRDPSLDSDAVQQDLKDYFLWISETLRARPTPERLMASCRARIPEADERELLDLYERLSCLDPETVSVLLRGQLLDGFDLEGAIRSLRCRALVVRGEWECGAAIRDEDAEWFLGCDPTAEIVLIPKGSHLLLWEQPERTTAVIKDFLDGLP